MFNNELHVNTKKIKAIIFDFDGVILDSVNIKTEAFRLLFNEFSIEIQDKVVAHHIKNGGMSRFDKIKFYFREYINKPLSEELFQEYLQRFETIVYNKVLACDFIPGCLEFLDLHKNEITYFVVSATPYNELVKIIKKRGVTKYFKAVYGSPISKSENINTILDTYKIHKEEVFYIGDSINDFEACIQSGILFVGVKS